VGGLGCVLDKSALEHTRLFTEDIYSLAGILKSLLAVTPCTYQVPTSPSRLCWTYYLLQYCAPFRILSSSIHPFYIIFACLLRFSLALPPPAASYSFPPFFWDGFTGSRAFDLVNPRFHMFHLNPSLSCLVHSALQLHCLM
jgi:hypothetical protein